MNYFKNCALELKSLVGENNILLNEPMKNHIYFKVGGPADIMVIPDTIEKVISVVNYCRDKDIPYFIIGNGSNLLVKDGGLRGVVIKLTELKDITVEGEIITAQCGAELKNVSKAALDNYLTGFEFACGIPGSIGGAIFMNAGAYDGEMSYVTDKVVVLDNDGKILEVQRDDLELGYRTSVIMKKGYVVLSVILKLKKGEHVTIDSRIKDLTKKREDRQPLEYPSAGSTFKRPEGYFTGKLIQDLGLKGTSIGGAAVSEKHAGFIINKGNATAKDILDLIEHVQKTVKESYGVDLHPEVRIIGEDLS
ncbi:UDP-N-acetylmuramate dehydrogenase [Clostridium hydrogeniformans]|uniref:UDP-N-acetylmuramate dehydrogenase n=1 Tax=Clostridium hydrogeniformans TaxID=349933 RepID=UPI0004884133|nr:UDP-N-acetylmuramate dehydrogenase [Clostridium hydrogeniformans]